MGVIDYEKNILSILFLAISITSFVGCADKEAVVDNKDISIVSSDRDNNSTKEESLPIADMSGKLVNYYETLDEINNNSEIVAMGTIIENEYVEYNGLIFTLSKFKVDNVVKGDVVVGDTIKVLQTGGISEVKINE